jgi:hypothetical protein
MTPATNPVPQPDTRLRAAARDTDGPIHTWFGLSYCNYQVLHRTLMQSMPIAWQERMVACLEELAAAFAHIELPEAFAVEAGEQHLVDELSEQQMARLGITRDEYDEEPPADLDPEALDAWQDEHRLREPQFYDANVDEIDGQSYVIVPTFDPVPAYNRGRTYIEPRPDLCPRCESPAPHLHPATQADGGEVQPCTHPFHQQAAGGDL